MVTHFDKNMYHNYMIIEEAYNALDKYQEEMLSNNQVNGLLPLEVRYYNNDKRYCYNITGLHDIRTIFEKKCPGKTQLESLFGQIISHIKDIHNYLLEENDIVLLPEQIFINSCTGDVKLCCFPGFNQDIMRQLSMLFEYFMNKIEYSDKEAVVFIYSLYMKSRDSECKINELLRIIENSEGSSLYHENNEISSNNPIKTVHHDLDLKSGLHNKLPDPQAEQKKHSHKEHLQSIGCRPVKPNKINNNESEINSIIHYHNKGHNAIEEEIEKESEVLYYPVKNYITALLSLTASFVLFYIIWNSGIIHQTFGKNIDKSKAGILIMLLITANLAVFYMLFNKNKKLSRMQAKTIYEVIGDNISSENIYYPNNKATILPYDETTVVLKDNRCLCSIMLVPEDDINYQAVEITEFPFYIGKLKYNTNSCIPKTTISKIHAKITNEKDGYMIHDLNSTNGTFVNEEKLPVNGAVRIVNNDKVGFADVIYIFKCKAESP